MKAAVCAFSSTSCITQRDVGTGRGRSGPPHVPVTRRPGQHRDSTRQLHRDVPWVRPPDGTAPLDDPGPASPDTADFTMRHAPGQITTYRADSSDTCRAIFTDTPHHTSKIQ